MATWVWIVIAIAAVVVIALVVWSALRARRTQTLKEGFGPEYDRTVADAPSRREAEAELTERQKRREELDIRPLEPDARERYAEEWQATQARFVDDPGGAVTEADVLIQRVMRSSTDLMFRARQVSNLGGFMSGVNNNGAHSANGITAMFIATGQDVANVAESSAAFVYAEVTEDGDYYYSVTIPSLIVATYGGGTGLATQRECLELLGCHGAGKVNKLAEIIAATALCGEISLGSAIVADEWVTSHDRLGRNRG